MEEEKKDFNPFGLEEKSAKKKSKSKKRRKSRVIKKTVVIEKPIKQDLRTKWVSPFKGAKKEKKKYFAVYTGRYKNMKLLPSVGKITPGKRFEVTLEMANVLRTSKDFRVTEIIAE